MGFYAVLDQVVALLRQRGRVTYRALKREFQLDDACLEDLKDELINAQHLAVDEQAAILVWTGAPPAAEPGIRQQAEAERQLYTVLLAVMALLQREQRVTYRTLRYVFGVDDACLHAAAIYPKEVLDTSGDGQVKQLTGTGPYRFVEHKADRHIRLARFKDYAARPELPDGFGGKRTAYFDEILFIPTPDVAVRMAGVETGEFHHASLIKPDQYDRLKELSALELSIIKLGSWPSAVLNHKQGLLTSKKLRQALQAALDMEPIMAAAIGHKEFYRLDGSVFLREQVWHSTAGVEAYNQRDKDKARRLLKEAGYTGQPVRWLTTQEYDFMYKTALVSKQQLEEVGFKIDLQVTDWATLVQRRGKPELYEVFSTGVPVFPGLLDPALALPCDWPGWWCHEEKDRLMVELGRETDTKKRKALVDWIQAIFYEDVGLIKFGDQFGFHTARKELRGGFRSTPTFFFWNAWLAR